MEKEVLISKLKPLIGDPDDKGFYSNGVTNRTFEDYVKNICSQISDDASDDVIKTHKAILDSMGGQLRFELGEFKKSQKPVPPVTPKPEENEALTKVLDELREMKKSNYELKMRLDNADKAKGQGEYKSALVKAMKEKGAENAYIIEKTLAGKEFDVTKDVNLVLDEYLKSYDADYSLCFGNGGSPRTPQGQGGSGDTTVLDSFFEEKKREGKMP